jgi:hypothetical protein
MPADFEASRRRSERDARRLLFTMAAAYFAVHVIASISAAYGSSGLLAALVAIDLVLLFIAFAFWLSGKIFR